MTSIDCLEAFSHWKVAFLETSGWYLNEINFWREISVTDIKKANQEKIKECQMVLKSLKKTFAKNKHCRPSFLPHLVYELESEVKRCTENIALYKTSKQPQGQSPWPLKMNIYLLHLLVKAKGVGDLRSEAISFFSPGGEFDKFISKEAEEIKSKFQKHKYPENKNLKTFAVYPIHQSEDWLKKRKENTLRAIFSHFLESTPKAWTPKQKKLVGRLNREAEVYSLACPEDYYLSVNTLLSKSNNQMFCSFENSDDHGH